MKKITYALSLVTLLNLTATADEWKKIDDGNGASSTQKTTPNNNSNNNVQNVYINTTPPPVHTPQKESTPVVHQQETLIQVGLLNSGTITYDVTDENGNTVVEDATLGDEEDGFEISLITGIDRGETFDGRVGLTFQSVDVYDRSTMSFLGEFLLALNINKFIAPYVGVNGGLAYLSNTNDSSLGFQFGAYAGVTGEIVSGIGYYAEIGKSVKGFSQTYGSSDYLTLEYSTPVSFGVNYIF